MWDGGKFTHIEQGDYVFSVRQMPPFASIRALGTLQKIIFPVISGVLDGASKTPNADTESLLDMAGILSKGLDKMVTNLDGDKLEIAIKILLNPEYVAVKAKSGKDFIRLGEGEINEVFGGRVIDMIALAVEVFKINYLDFSKLSSVPTGVLETLAEAKSKFLGQSASIFSK